VTLGRALDITDETVEALKGDYLKSEFFTAAEKAAMKWAEVLTLKQYQATLGNPPQSPQAMAELKEHFNEAQIVEITMVSGFFNFWNRFTDGLQIDLENDPIMDLIKKSARVDPADYVAFMRECWWNHAELAADGRRPGETQSGDKTSATAISEENTQ
jgi:hypothetical protein